MNAIQLEPPSLKLLPKFMEFINEMQSHNETLWDPYIPAPNETSEEFVSRQLKRETLPESHSIPETIYWAKHSNGSIVGRISLRHLLNDHLRIMGGHIGYEVRPSYRRQGIATEMLRLILKTDACKQIGEVLLTCHPENWGSNQTIIKNGGVLLKTIFVERVNAYRNHYLIKVT